MESTTSTRIPRFRALSASRFDSGFSYFWLSMALVQMSISSGRHRAERHLARIDVIPPLDIDQILRAREQRSPAQANPLVRLRLVLRAIEQLVDDVLRSRLVRIDIREQHEVRQEHAPMLAEARQQPRPVDLLLPCADEVQHVGAVEALALHEKRLRPDHFLDGHQPHGKAERLVPHRIREPFVVHFGDAVAAGENQVDEELALTSAVRLAEPVRKCELGRDAASSASSARSPCPSRRGG